MRTAAKVFTILGMVFGAILILPIVFGAIGLKKMDDPMTTKDDMTVWGILVLVFCSLLGGLFMLLMLDEYSNNKPVIEAKVEEKKEDK